jgi:pimeloyl-ACP methyl ester carboxylesterase
LEDIYAQNQNQPITVIAHSMGGLITLSVLNRRPEMFKGVVFCGTPFGPVPMILWAFQRGAPFASLFSSEMHFSARSAFLFLPKDGKALVDSSNDEDILIDYFNPQE